jgi:predicted enzyme related to lactoylglutathione lyase
VPIICIARVIVAVADLDAARQRWSRAGFALAPSRDAAGGLRVAPIGAGAVEIDLCASAGADAPPPLSAALARGGGIAGWTWGVSDSESPATENPFALPTGFLPGVSTGSAAANPDAAARREDLVRTCGPNPNTVDYLEHIVVMTPSLEDAIAAHEKVGLPCKRIREAGRGMRQAFFKLEQTVLEIVGPASGAPHVWGLAFMCKDIARAVAVARENGLQATEPKAAIQGGKIARIVDPIDGVAIAFMEN